MQLTLWLVFPGKKAMKLKTSLEKSIKGVKSRWKNDIKFYVSC